MMMRLHYLQIAVCTGLLVLCSDLTTTEANQRPNVLLIVADDLNCAIGPYGDASAKTPNLDRLAARGLTFQNCYCQQAVCNPSRSSFLTGLRPDTVGVDDLRRYFRETAVDGDTLVTLPQYFKSQGYFCRNVGKMFHNMGETQDRRSWSVDEMLYRGTHADDTVFASQRREGEKRPYKAPVTESLDVDDTAYRDGRITEAATAMLRDHDKSVPFFLAVGYWRPHLPFVAPKKYWDLYDPGKIPMPDPGEPPKDVPEIAMHNSREIRGYGEMPKDRPFTLQEIRHLRHGYYASISFLDHQVGQLLDALRSGGHADNTIVVFTSDHGFHIGEHTLWGKTTNFELDARVPLIVADPRTTNSHGQQSDSLCELVDLFPTLADIAGMADELPDRLEGVSLRPVIEEPDHIVKAAAFTQHQSPFYGSRSNWKAWGYSIRTSRWRFTQWRSIRDGEVIARELYDHHSDPLETVNLVGQSQHRSLISELETGLVKMFPMD